MESGDIPINIGIQVYTSVSDGEIQKDTPWPWRDPVETAARLMKSLHSAMITQVKPCSQYHFRTITSYKSQADIVARNQPYSNGGLLPTDRMLWLIHGPVVSSSYHVNVSPISPASSVTHKPRRQSYIFHHLLQTFPEEMQGCQGPADPSDQSWYVSWERHWKSVHLNAL